MNIAYLLPLSLIDYLDKLSAVIFTAGCNFRCPYCYNSELVLPERISTTSSVSEDEVFSFLTQRRGLLDGVVISGGEPLLQPGLRLFITKIKELGFLTKLDTNGAFPKILKELLRNNLLDYVAMDIKRSTDYYEVGAGVAVDLERIITSIHLIINCAPDYEFRTTVVPDIDEEELIKITTMITGAKRYILQPFIVPAHKELVGPMEERAPHGPEMLNHLWERIKDKFPAGGVRQTGSL
ncbi:anaerobic ribonucleoside-triphosphate reductase activating protein [Candidatus Acetothermia bacterium]|jgi:pyruvate formate lyase activating enzyme|nr:anaerobic ribonucleoside-triphosphate reductase activating protein [Candidatus Acetothermia bacterium]MCI2427564.1 anaerobic ribonucleoside-triphosphate reductase activating protein [Candidatus Acetothermia bacterium]MCI2428246.1 anaerobic ribonucleoside-triphosphate reductase activating protein [Candidatus Acetothermia bacterium]